MKKPKKKSSYFSKKIVNEIKLSRICFNSFAEALLDFNNIKGTIIDRIYNDTQLEILDFIKEYEPYIKKVCNNRKYYLKDEVRDCEQFIKMYLCKLYYKKHKYSNFGKVVHSVIKRKAIDFSKGRNQDLKGIITETDYMVETDTASSFIEQHSSFEDASYRTNLSGNIVNDELSTKDEENFGKDLTDIQNIITELSETAHEIPQFSERDLTVMSKVKECVDNGICDLDIILSKISDSKFKATKEFGFLVNKISKYIDESKYL